MGASRFRSIDLEGLLVRLNGFPVIALARAGSSEMRRRHALDVLKSRRVQLRGSHSTVVNALVSYESDRQTELLQAYDEHVERVLNIRADGRPNKHSALRDFLIFTEQHLLRSFSFGGREPLEVRDARKRTAQIFGLTCDTKFARTRRLSIDQVKWAEERTLARFELLRMVRGEDLLGPAWLKGVYVLGFFISEQNGAPLNAEAFVADATCLISICRTLDAVERLDRIEKSAARKAGKNIARRPGNATPDLSVN